ncbi:hypothetical protein AZE42_02679 [Rhizopogon vesiculosus]|uniref:Uncharacterized protein n=1 Tax=Rhizopogon vesiculosus TaxID=180088 RepID=A0A1J8R8M9_9AGAM|nr:hypothetical protein AZE42_02679 [Rhizopogon vesiculosus]
MQVINHINISLFTPALLFSKVAFFLSPAKLKELWIIPIFFVVVTCLSGNFAMAASMFMNPNSLLIALMQSLVPGVHDLKWMPDDNKDAMLGSALTYLVLYSTLGMMVHCVNLNTVIVGSWSWFQIRNQYFFFGWAWPTAP